MSKDKTKYVYKTTLSKRFGLTPKLIKELDPPDKEVVNPHWKSGPPAYLYDVARVEEFIAQNEKRVEKERRLREKLSAVGRANYQRRLKKEVAEAKQWAESVRINIYTFPSDLDRVRTHSGGKGLRSHIRHRYTNYELVLRDLYEYRSDTQGEVYPLLKARFEEAVDTAVHEWELEQHRNRFLAQNDSQEALPVIAPAV